MNDYQFFPALDVRSMPKERRTNACACPHGVVSLKNDLSLKDYADRIIQIAQAHPIS